MKKMEKRFNIKIGCLVIAWLLLSSQGIALIPHVDCPHKGFIIYFFTMSSRHVPFLPQPQLAQI